MDATEFVRDHYSGARLGETILEAAAGAGIDLDTLTAADLAPVDNLHAGGPTTTARLLEHLDLGSASRVLDVGCGLGGPSRYAADHYGCAVVGFDLSPDFVETARTLTERVGLAGLVEHHVTDGNRFDAEDGAYDRAFMIHVGMNVSDKRALFREVRRVLRPGALFGLFEQMQIADGALPYPLPWAEDDRSSFVESPEAYTSHLQDAGFAVESAHSSTEVRPAPPPGLSPVTVFGPVFAERIGNNLAATRAGLLASVTLIARAR